MSDERYVTKRLLEIGGHVVRRRSKEPEARIVNENCRHYWLPDAFGSGLMVCHNCWSTRK